MMTATYHLETNGVVVLKIPDEMEIPPEPEWKRCIGRFREIKYKTDLVGRPTCLRSGDIACPSSFHNELVRAIRLQIHYWIQSLFEHRVGERIHFWQLLEPLCWRKANALPPPWVTKLDQVLEPVPTIGPFDPVNEWYRGWINLDQNDGSISNHVFECVPLSSPNDNQTFIRYEVPPGHLILFNSRVRTRMTNVKLNQDSLRLNIGFRLSSDLSESEMAQIGSDINRICFNQGPALEFCGGTGKSAHVMRPFKMIRPWQLTFQRRQLVQWSQDTFQDICCDPDTKLVHAEMKSLTEYKFDLYTPYAESELSILKPTPLKRRFVMDDDDDNDDQDNINTDLDEDSDSSSSASEETETETDIETERTMYYKRQRLL